MKDKPLNRMSLKTIFSNGSRPSENNFGSLIDSMVNKVDDGISKNLKDGLILSPEGNDSERLVSFYDKIQDDNPKWSFNLMKEKAQGLGIVETVTEQENEPRLFLAKGGDIGINTTSPKANLDVNGVLGVNTRIGTYKIDTVPADGNWHNVITGLNGCCAFEIVAQVGKEKSGRYALLHANALSTFGHSRNKIKTTQAHYGWWWNKIALRWTGSTYNYSLQMRTRSNYGSGLNIKFYITKLWDNDVMSMFDNLEQHESGGTK